MLPTPIQAETIIAASIGSILLPLIRNIYLKNNILKNTISLKAFIHVAGAFESINMLINAFLIIIPEWNNAVISFIPYHIHIFSSNFADDDKSFIAMYLIFGAVFAFNFFWNECVDFIKSN